MVETRVLVNLSEICVKRKPAILSCIGLGSCIGLCAYDPKVEVGGMVHLMLPESRTNSKLEQPGKFINTGIAKLVEFMEENGALRSRILIAYAGGAQLFRTSFNTPLEGFNVGHRNQIATEHYVKQLGLKCVARDIGGEHGRNIVLFTETAEVQITNILSRNKTLCLLR